MKTFIIIIIIVIIIIIIVVTIIIINLKKIYFTIVPTDLALINFLNLFMKLDFPIDLIFRY